MRCALFAFTILGLSLSIRADAPSGTMPLFNGKDLTGWYTYLTAPAKGEPVLGKNNDPKKVFSVVTVDGAPAVRISGEVFGGIITEQEYSDYRLIVEFKWGPKTFAPREKAARDSGILLHCTGNDGTGGGHWLPSIECQLIEGGSGDFIVISGPTKTQRITCEVESKPTGPKNVPQSYFKAGGAKKEFAGGRVNWFGRDPQWTDTLGFRGAQDVEKPVGEWNVVECVCAGANITNILNGTTVNHATNVTPTKGKILIQSEGAELFVRKVELRPIK
jgi:hypothetical protein